MEIVIINIDETDPTSLTNDPHWMPLLPKYNETQIKIMTDTMDFVALNYYSASYVSYASGVYPGYYLILN